MEKALNRGEKHIFFVNDVKLLKAGTFDLEYAVENVNGVELDDNVEDNVVKVQTVVAKNLVERVVLLENTTGDSYYVFRPEGLAEIVENIVDAPQGVYQLSYVSTLPTNFGENYLPLETEVYLLNRSGRDESGYFAPLQ